MKPVPRSLIIVISILMLFPQCLKAQWVQTGGPGGGTFRSIVFNGTDVYTSSKDGIFRSTNNGKSWKPVDSLLTDRFDIFLAVCGNNFFAGKTGGIFISTDNGAHWKASSLVIPPYGNIRIIAVNGSSVFAGFDLNFFFSTDSGANWKAVSQVPVPVPSGSSITAALLWRSKIFAGTNGDGVFISADSGSSWNQSNAGMEMFPMIRSFLVHGDDLFVSTDQGVYLSTDTGRTWNSVSFGLPANKGVFSIAADGNDLFAGTTGGGSLFGAGVYRSTDNGANWKAVNTDLPANIVVYLIAVNNGNIFAGTFEGGLFLSSNHGDNWKAINSGLPFATIKTFTLKGTRLYAGTLCGVALSTDNGITWSPASTGLPTMTEVRSLAVIDSTVFAGTRDSGLFVSTNNGSSWSAFNTGLSVPTTVCALSIFGNNLLAGIEGRGVWRRPLSEVVPVKHDTPHMRKQQPMTILAVNGPHPAAVIKFLLADPVVVLCKIYNLSGRVIATPVNKKLGAGSYNVLWDIGNTAPGCYMLKACFGRNVSTKRIILER